MRKPFPAHVLADLGLDATAPRTLDAPTKKGRRKRATKARATNDVAPPPVDAQANRLLERVSLALQPELDDFDAAWEENFF